MFSCVGLCHGILSGEFKNQILPSEQSYEFDWRTVGVKYERVQVVFDESSGCHQPPKIHHIIHSLSFKMGHKPQRWRQASSFAVCKIHPFT
jgi:hypothetical protein